MTGQTKKRNSSDEKYEKRKVNLKQAISLGLNRPKQAAAVLQKREKREQKMFLRAIFRFFLQQTLFEWTQSKINLHSEASRSFCQRLKKY